jgi:hypothetical protein
LQDATAFIADGGMLSEELVHAKSFVGLSEVRTNVVAV